MNLSIVNSIILAEAEVVTRTTTASSGDYWWVVWLWALAFFVIGFLVGLIIWRNLIGNTFSIEEDNRRMAAAFKKREQAYLDNRRNASSILGQPDSTDVREVRR